MEGGRPKPSWPVLDNRFRLRRSQGRNRGNPPLLLIFTSPSLLTFDSPRDPTKMTLQDPPWIILRPTPTLWHIYMPDILFLCVSCAHFYANIFFITSCVCTPFAKRKTRFLLFNRRWSKRLIDIREGNFKNSSETMHNSWIFACDLFLFTIRTRLFSTIIRRREKIQRTCFVNRDDIFLVTRCS